MVNLQEKYSPKKLDDFYINNETKDILRVFLDMDAINILFVGDTGTGKTNMIDVMLS